MENAGNLLQAVSTLVVFEVVFVKCVFGIGLEVVLGTSILAPVSPLSLSYIRSLSSHLRLGSDQLLGKLPGGRISPRKVKS